MKPISFEDVCKTKKSGNEMCSIIKDASQWSKYNGYGILPGVEKAEYMVKTERMVGSQFSVINSDGSNHIEEVMEWVEGGE